jgi:hypothetical protein
MGPISIPLAFVLLANHCTLLAYAPDSVRQTAWRTTFVRRGTQEPGMTKNLNLKAALCTPQSRSAGRIIKPQLPAPRTSAGMWSGFLVEILFISQHSSLLAYKVGTS